MADKKTTIDPARYTKSLRARRLRGAAALMEMLAHIGADDVGGDQKVAAILVEYELELREMLAFSIAKITEPGAEEK